MHGFDAEVFEASFISIGPFIEHLLLAADVKAAATSQMSSPQLIMSVFVPTR